METQAFYANINYLAVLVAAIAYFALGFVWYSVLFSKMWMEAKNMKAEEMKNDNLARTFITTFILNFLLAMVTAMFVSALNASSVADGINLGIRIAIGFALTTMGINYMYDNKPAKLYWIDAGYHFVGIIITTVILSIWK